jgi:LmbE family N-acetylglucosaminyl deacetylase
MSFNPAERIRRATILARTRLMRHLAAMLQEWSGACQRVAERPWSGVTPSAALETKRARTKPAWGVMLRNWSHPATLETLLSRGLIGDDLPRQFGLPAGRRILVLAAHQDDEIIGAGGTFLLCAREGRAFKVIYYTDGATSVAGMPPDEVSRWRHAEARHVWRRLAGVEPTFWDYPNRSGQLAADAALRLKQAIDEFRPDVIFVPSFFEQPTDHRQLNDLLLQASRLRALPHHIEIWAYQITTRIPGNRAVDITAVWKKKYALNRLWASQNVYMNYAHLAMGRDIANAYYLKGRRNTRYAASYAELFLVFDSKQYLALAGEFRPRTIAPPDGRCPPPDFLVVGLQKSGTYWVTALLDAHPEIRCFPSRPGHADGTGEAHFFDLLARMDVDFSSFHRSMRKKLGGQFASVLPEQAPPTEALRHELRLRLRDRFNEYCFTQRVEAGKQLVGEKTTETIFHPELVGQLYPGIPKVCILRDPRDRAVSFFFHQQRKAKTAREAVMTAADARAYVARVRQDYEGLLRMPDPVHVLTYEQLSASPQREVKRLLDFLGVDASAEAIARTLEGSSFRALAGREPGDENVHSHFRQGRPGNWSRHFDDGVGLEMAEALDDLTRQLELRFGLDLSSYRAIAAHPMVPAP